MHSCSVLLVFTALARHAGVALAGPQELDDGGVAAAALSLDDECASASSEGSCGISALQLRVRKGAKGAAAATFEAAPPHRPGWTHQSRALGSSTHELVFIIDRPGMRTIEEVARDRSDPDSPSYGKWLSAAEVQDIARNEEGVQHLKAALSQLGSVTLLSETPGGELVRARAPISTWEALLSTEFHIFRHSAGRRLARADSYSLPAALEGHVAGIRNVLELAEHASLGDDASLGDERQSRSFFSTAQTGDLPFPETRIPVITPPVLRKAYQIPEPAPRGSAAAAEEGKIMKVIFASINQHWSPDDRTKFQEYFDIPQDQYVREIDKVMDKSSNNVCIDTPDNCDEATLDVQYVMAVSPWSQTGFYYQNGTADDLFNDFLTGFSNYILSATTLPHVISISYGIPELGISASSRKLFAELAASLAAQGVSIVAASGDTGAANWDNVHNCSFTEEVGLMVNWPASDPWVTSVGATMGAESGSVENEVVCSVNGSALYPPSITSGGGFSYFFKRPAYQDAHHNESSLGVPDVSLAGHLYSIVLGGSVTWVDGTSASAPVFAGMLALLNARRLAKGLPSLGFVNPLLYTKAVDQGVFNDITTGDNICAGAGKPCCGGYEATEGWDAASGLGSLDFDKLSKVVGA